VRPIFSYRRSAVIRYTLLISQNWDTEIASVKQFGPNLAALCLTVFVLKLLGLDSAAKIWILVSFVLVGVEGSSSPKIICLCAFGYPGKLRSY